MYPYSSKDMHLYRDVAKAIEGQYNAIHYYHRLAQLAPTKEEKEQILEIREDEIRHYRVFSDIYYHLTCHRFKPKLTEKGPEDYRSGLKFAIEDEQKTVDFYLEVADRTKDKYIKKHFKRAAADEQNHAVWFLYYFTKLCHN